MRLFVSVEPSPSARTDLAEMLDRLDLNPARLVSPERWHVTLAFLGAVDDGRVPGLNDRLAEVASGGRSMRLWLAGAGLFPSPARPAVIWVGLAGDVEPLRQLAGDVADAMRLAGIELEHRRFRPHLTVARYREPPTQAVRETVSDLASYTGPEFSVDWLQLMRSWLGPHPRHEALGSWELAGQRNGGAN